MSISTKEKANIPALRFPEFVDGLAYKKLWEFAEFSKGKGISKADIDENGVTECIRYGQLYTQYGEKIDKVVSKTNVDVRQLTLSEDNDIIIPASGETQIDIATASCVVRKGIALGGDLNIIKTNENGVFLSYYFNSNKKIDIARLAQGISVVHLYATQLKTLKVNLPSLPEQEKIAAFLGAVDEKVTQLSRKKDLLTTYKKSMMQKLFSQEVRFKDKDGSDFPDWKEGKLYNVFHECSERGNESATLLSVTMKQGVVRAEDLERTVSASVNRSNYKSVYKGDIAYNSMRMWQGASGVSDHDGIVSPAYTVIRPYENHSSIFWGYYFKLRNVIALFQRYSQGMTSDTWNLKFRALSSIKLTYPDSMEEQKHIADFLSAIDEKIELTTQQLTHAKAFKKGLLQQMFV